ncbi:Uncharacterised protein [Brevibacterium casei]|uniref:Uncharacterized protein n=1 Tax=Brevibacterium casei TaxID=33889 RepID=A0A449D7D6_9MICO|nr:helix-turn-helix transcriptional regulator [Brevibacterium casei]VEW13511.1 Uncharacterised protein [Brevibacterium casei]
MNWNDYVARVAEGETQATIAAKLGVSGPTVSRWKKFGPRPENVSTFARAYGRPVLEAFVAAGYLTPEEAGETPTAAPSLASLTDDELVRELTRRLKKAGEDDASTPLTRAGVSPAEEELAADFIAHKQRPRADPAPDDPEFESFLKQQAAKRGPNRGKQIRRQQDDDAE